VKIVDKDDLTIDMGVYPLVPAIKITKENTFDTTDTQVVTEGKVIFRIVVSNTSTEPLTNIEIIDAQSPSCNKNIIETTEIIKTLGNKDDVLDSNETISYDCEITNILVTSYTNNENEIIVYSIGKETGFKVTSNDKSKVEHPINIGDYVWYDVNKNGLQDELPKYGINGVKATLYCGEVEVKQNAYGQVLNPLFTSNLNGDVSKPGYYIFKNIKRCDKLHVVFSELPEDHTVTLQNKGSDNNLDSDVDKDKLRGEDIDVTTSSDYSTDMGLYVEYSSLYDPYVCGAKYITGFFKGYKISTLIGLYEPNQSTPKFVYKDIQGPDGIYKIPVDYNTMKGEFVLKQSLTDKYGDTQEKFYNITIEDDCNPEAPQEPAKPETPRTGGITQYSLLIILILLLTLAIANKKRKL
jgi:uncharacterized repeat protein (TIGR01451 family)